MASWMVHLRVADQLIDRITNQKDDLDKTAFVVGNIAPDSGVPTADWSAYVPDKNTSHFKTMRGAAACARGDGKPQIDVESFIEKYFIEEMRTDYDQRQYSFYLGYLTHLLTDVLWVREIYWPAVAAEAEAYAADHLGTVRKWKKDWYDLDFLYLQEHPDFRAFQIYEAAAGFHNDLMKEFPENAFDDRRQYIIEFYHQQRHDLDRQYPYLTRQQMDDFVNLAVHEITKYMQQTL